MKKLILVLIAAFAIPAFAEETTPPAADHTAPTEQTEKVEKTVTKKKMKKKKDNKKHAAPAAEEAKH